MRKSLEKRSQEAGLPYQSFLTTGETIPFCNRDFVEWHGGISHYGFWAVLVDDIGWLDLIETARSHVRQFIHPGYQRVPHITVTACGLLSGVHFSSRLLRRQVAALSKARIAPFSLRVGALESFASAPYIKVKDRDRSLDRIRSLLTGISSEDSPAGYTPHITLGLYIDAFDTLKVIDCLRNFRPAATGPMSVSELAFCAYETRNIQGPLTVMERVALHGT